MTSRAALRNADPVGQDARPSTLDGAGVIPPFHQGPRVCDVQPLPEDHPRRNSF